MYNVLSSKTCCVKGCNTLLKKRIVLSKPTADMCYKHHVEKEARRGRFILGKPAPVV